MWVKSRMGSKPTFLFMAGPSTWVGMPDTISVRPSGSARATASVPTSPPPPTRFSTWNCLPKAMVSASAWSRPMVSAAPPAANGTTTRTGLLGHSAAKAQADDAATAAMTARIRIMCRRDPFVSLFLFRLIEDVQHPLRLRHGHRRGYVFELERLFQRHVESFHLGELQGLFRKEIIARLLRQRARHFGDLGVIIDGVGIGIGPVDRAAQSFDEAHEGIAPLLERIGVGDVHANGLLRERLHIAAARDDDEPAVRQLLQHEGRHRPPDVDLPGHHLRERGGRAAGGDELGRDLRLVY